MMGGVLVFDKNFYRCYISKVIGVLLQVALIFFLISLYKRLTATVYYADIITFLFIVCIHFTAIVISSYILCWYDVDFVILSKFE